MGKLIVELPEELHMRLKRQAAEDHQTLKVVVTTLLQHYLAAPRQRTPARSTGLCGIWKGAESAEELTKTIRAARRWTRDTSA
jgi:hypothetical protein